MKFAILVIVLILIGSLVVITVSCRLQPSLNLSGNLQFFIHVDGEPVPHARAEFSDLAILSGGANLYDHAFYLPLLALEKKWTFLRKHRSWDDRPIDIFMRTSNCTRPRIELMSEICRIAQDQGIVVAIGGKCGVNCKTPAYQHDYKPGEASQDWGECEACEESKVVMAFENFSEGYEYLSEKPFLPLEMGSLGIYIGNGIELLKECGINVADKFIFTGSSYDISQASSIVKTVKDLITNPGKAAGIMETNPFQHEILTIESVNLRKLQEFCHSHPKLQRIKE